MIELMFPQTVSNILDYDGIKAAAKKYVEDIFVQIIESFGNNLVLQSMDEEHLAEVAGHVTGDPKTTLEELLDYINTSNTYHEFEFVDELTTAFPEGVEYKEFEVTGWQFPNADFPPFSEPDRSYNYDGTPQYGGSDDVWMENAMGEEGVHNLMMSRFRGNYFDPEDYESITWFKTSGRRASWGNEETWMTTGGFGKPSTIHINVDEVRTVIEKNGLSSVENWLGTVSNKLPINLYIEINDQLRTYDADDDVSGLAGSTEGYPMAFPYEEEEGFCTNDPDWPGPEPEPEPALPTVEEIGYLGVNNLDVVQISSGANKALRKLDENVPIPYKFRYVYSSISYLSAGSGSLRSAGIFDLVDIMNGSSFILGVKNISSSTQVFFAIRAVYCDSRDATVITVYDSSNNPYNAFKYTSDGTDYYYVLDGVQTDWTDDLASIGYHMPPALPTVEMINSRIGTIDSVGTISSWSNGDSAYQWRSIGGVYSLYTTENTLYIVCCGRIDNTTASNAVFHGFDAEFDLQGHIKITNNTGSTYSNAYSSLSYVCKNSSATVITVYDSSNNLYNAFKYTSDGTDYYYVLDDTQTDWTDDLASIGYHLTAQYLELVVGFMSSGVSAVDFGTNDYWYAQILSNGDKASLFDFGGEIISSTNLIKATPSFFYEVADIYTGNGTGSIPVADLSNFRCAIGTKGYPGALNIKNTNAYSYVRTWKVRITKVPNVAWVKADKGEDWTGYAGSLPLYDNNGNSIAFDSTKTYTIIGYYTSENSVDLSRMTTENNYGLSIINNSGYCKIKWANNTTLLIQRVIYKVE